MAEHTGSTTPDSINNFENDFEKVEPQHTESPVSEQAPGVTVSLTPADSSVHLVEAVHAEAEHMAQPLISFGEQSEAAKSKSQLEETPILTNISKAAASVPEFVEEITSSSAKLPDPVIPTKHEAPSHKVAESSSCSGCCFKNIDPRVLDLIYWRDIKKSALVFGSLFVLLLALSLFSIVSVVAYLCLALLTITFSFVVYKKVMGAIQKSGPEHPFHNYLNADISLPEEKIHQAADVIVARSAEVIKHVRHVFLVEDIVDSLKFLLVLWVLTYIGSWFNGMTLLILGLIEVFTLPKVYEVYKVQIDHYLDLVKTHITNVWNKVQEKLPLPGKNKKE